MFLISFRNILCPQQMFAGLRSIETIMSNNVSSFAITLKLQAFDSRPNGGMGIYWNLHISVEEIY